MRDCGCKGLAHSSACRLRDTPMPNGPFSKRAQTWEAPAGSGDVCGPAAPPCTGSLAPDPRPEHERYYPLDRPLPGDAFAEKDPPDIVGYGRPKCDCGVSSFAPREDHKLGCPVEAAWAMGVKPQEARTALPTSALARKELPLATGLLDYFPAALVAVAGLSRVGNEQHNPGKPLHWDRSKSGDEADALLRHFVERGTIDTDGLRHSTKVAWRALAMLQKELEAAGLAPLSRGSR